MELRHIQYFKTLAEELHFGNAAKKLFISQPPLSRQIKELEIELDVELFIRNNKKVELTDAGKYFYKQVDELTRQLDRIKNTTRLIREQVSGELRLGYISSTPKTLIAKILEDLKNTFPLLQINLIEASSRRQVDALMHGKLDLSIIRGEIAENHLIQQLLFDDELCIVGPKDSDMTVEAVAVADFISFNSDYAPDYYQLSLDFCKQLGFRPKVKHQCNNMNAILELVRLGIGYTIAPFSTVSDRDDLTVMSSARLGEKVQSKVYLVYHKDNARSNIRQIVEQVLRVL